ncbi:MAG: pyridoxamine 5'-phosphate oxidase family protein [Pseudomonadota bacterium]
MTTPQDLENKFWKSLKSDMTVMLGLHGVQDSHTRPMTAQLDDERGPVWFFTAKDTALAQTLNGTSRAVATFTSKGHDLFASIHGTLQVETDRKMVDKLWNVFVAAWYEGGQNDPKLELLRFDPDSAEIWLNETSLMAGIKLILGMDPKDEYQDKVAKVRLG